MKSKEQAWLDDLVAFYDKEFTPKQARIVEAAIEIFSEKGFAATSTSEIAKRAGVAEGTIFRHYSTKKELLISIVSPVLSKFAVPFFAEKFVKEVFQENQTQELDTLLRKLIKNRYEFVKKNLPLIKIVLQEISYHPEIQNSFGQVFKEKIYPYFVQKIEQIQGQENLVNFPAETIIRLTMSTILGFLITRFIIMPDFPWEDEDEIEYTIQFIRNGLKAY